MSDHHAIATKGEKWYAFDPASRRFAKMPAEAALLMVDLRPTCDACGRSAKIVRVRERRAYGELGGAFDGKVRTYEVACGCGTDEFDVPYRVLVGGPLSAWYTHRDLNRVRQALAGGILPWDAIGHEEREEEGGHGEGGEAEATDEA